jgi:hypothetical protein
LALLSQFALITFLIIALSPAAKAQGESDEETLQDSAPAAQATPAGAREAARPPSVASQKREQGLSPDRVRALAAVERIVVPSADSTLPDALAEELRGKTSFGIISVPRQYEFSTPAERLTLEIEEANAQAILLSGTVMGKGGGVEARILAADGRTLLWRQRVAVSAKAAKNPAVLPRVASRLIEAFVLDVPLSGVVTDTQVNGDADLVRVSVGEQDQVRVGEWLDLYEFDGREASRGLWLSRRNPLARARIEKVESATRSVARLSMVRSPIARGVQVAWSEVGARGPGQAVPLLNRGFAVAGVVGTEERGLEREGSGESNRAYRLDPSLSYGGLIWWREWHGGLQWVAGTTPGGGGLGVLEAFASRLIWKGSSLDARAGLRLSHFISRGNTNLPAGNTLLSPLFDGGLTYRAQPRALIRARVEVFAPVISTGMPWDVFTFGAGPSFGFRFSLTSVWTVDLTARVRYLRRSVEGRNAVQERDSAAQLRVIWGDVP